MTSPADAQACLAASPLSFTVHDELSARRAAQAAAARQRRDGEQLARCHTVEVCARARTQGVPRAAVTRRLRMSPRTLRDWHRRARRATPPANRGRPPRPATLQQRQDVAAFLQAGGPGLPTITARAAFPDLARDDVAEVAEDYRRWHTARVRGFQSRLIWNRPGSVWAMDFKELVEPVALQYRWIFSVRDLASRYHLLWRPLVVADAASVIAALEELFREHGHPLVAKADNGSPFRAAELQAFLQVWQVLSLFNPPHCPAFNGGIERANRTLLGYQQASAEFHGRPDTPRLEDALAAPRMANAFTRPFGLWREAPGTDGKILAPTAGQIWQGRIPLESRERAAFLAAVDARRALLREAYGVSPAEPLDHYARAALDRQALRDVLVDQDLLEIVPRWPRRSAADRARELARLVWRDGTVPGGERDADQPGHAHESHHDDQPHHASAPEERAAQPDPDAAQGSANSPASPCAARPTCSAAVLSALQAFVVCWSAVAARSPRLDAPLPLPAATFIHHGPAANVATALSLTSPRACANATRQEKSRAHFAHDSRSACTLMLAARAGAMSQRTAGPTSTSDAGPKPWSREGPFLHPKPLS